MKKILVFLSLLLVGGTALGQSTLKWRADTIKVMKEGGNAVLVVQNSTRDTTGLAYNAGGGEVRFKTPYVLNDSAIVLGADTLIVHGTGGTSDLTIEDVNTAIAAVVSGLNIHMDSVLFLGTGELDDFYTPDTTIWIETKYHAKQRLDSIVNAIAALPATSGGIIDLIENATGTGDTLWVQVNDSTGYIKRLRNGTNVTFTVDGNSIIINASSGSAEVNADSSNVNTTTDIVVTGSAMLTFVMVKPASNLSGFKIGTAADDDKYFPATPVTATAEFVVFDVGAYLQGTTAVRLSGITSATDYILKFEPIHL